ncbi:hypothetical protein B296_00005503 [Ensete ventricosum]|uniref:Uncharacterized protein n=1 Tax=Ensete ventricosum TaxID=4639 RepID=A0A427AUB1_ENSVE|nr:hypothetical protein B296_00005503 [Ensete ventricosum]
MKVGEPLKQQPITILVDTRSTNSSMISKVHPPDIPTDEEAQWVNRPYPGVRMVELPRLASKPPVPSFSRYV